jgi:hypothetical protein
MPSHPRSKNLLILNDATRVVHSKASLCDPSEHWPFDREADRQAFLERAKSEPDRRTLKRMQRRRELMERVATLETQGLDAEQIGKAIGHTKRYVCKLLKEWRAQSREAA